MPHWRSFFPESPYLCARDLLDANGKPFMVTLTITRVQQGELTNGQGKKDRKAMITFAECKKQYGAGVTVCKAIGQLYTDQVQSWNGKRITLYVTQTAAKGGELVPCLRVRPQIPPQNAPLGMPKNAAQYNAQMQQAEPQQFQDDSIGLTPDDVPLPDDFDPDTDRVVSPQVRA